MGHRAGTDVFALVYTLDSRLKEHLAPVAREGENKITESGIAGLMVPTGMRPSYGSDLDQERLLATDAVLEATGWQVREYEDLVDVKEAAVILGMAENSTRRLFGKMFPCVETPRGRCATHDDVFAYRQRWDGYHQLPDVAATAGVEYHPAYRVMQRLGIEPKLDDYSRSFMLSGEEAERIIAEVARLHRLHERSMTVAATCARLGAAHSSIHKWVKEGRLAYDEETDGKGTHFITRASVEAEAVRRRNRRPSVRVDAFKLATGFDGAEVTALVRAKCLVRDRTGELTPESVRAWVVGFRPDLLDSELLESVPT
jgi:transposase-like protein